MSSVFHETNQMTRKQTHEKTNPKTHGKLWLYYTTDNVVQTRWHENKEMDLHKTNQMTRKRRDGFGQIWCGSKELDSNRSGPKDLDLNSKRSGRTEVATFLADQNGRGVAPCMSAAQKSITCFPSKFKLSNHLWFPQAEANRVAP